MGTSRIFIGEKIIASNGEEVGVISEVLLNHKTGKEEFGIFSFGGFMGIGKKLIAAPAETLIFNEEGNYYELNVDVETLEEAILQMERNGRTYFLF